LDYRIPRSPNAGKWRRPSSVPHSLKAQKMELKHKDLFKNISVIPKVASRAIPPRLTDPYSLIKNMRIKQFLVYFELHPQHNVSDILFKLLQTNNAFVAGTKKEVLWMEEKTLKAEAKKLEIEKGEKPHAIFFSDLIRKCKPLITNEIPEDAREREALILAYRKALIFMFGQAARAKDNDSDFVKEIIIPRIRDYLLNAFSNLKESEQLTGLILRLTVKELVMTCRTLNMN
jgi:hypothetical protein